MILPLRLRGTETTNSISRGATAAPRRRRASASSSRRSSSLGSRSNFNDTHALTT